MMELNNKLGGGWKLDSVKCRFPETLVMPSIMSNLWEQFQHIESIDRKPGQGHLRTKRADKDCYLSNTVRGSKSTTFQLFCDFYVARGSGV